MGKGRQRAGRDRPASLFAEDAGRLPWLPLLLQAHAVTDAGVAAAVLERERRGARLACRPGCTVCCRGQNDIAVYPLELAGISWYCVEKIPAPARAAVRSQLEAHEPGGPCPFLVAGSCAVYVVRPMACRRFNVFGTPCAEGEDPWHTRRNDALVPSPRELERAVKIMLPFHGVTEVADQARWLAERLHHALVRNLPDLEWRSLARLMDAAAGRAGSGSAYSVPGSPILRQG